MIAAPTTGALAVVLNTVLQMFNAGSSFLYTDNSPIGGGGETPRRLLPDRLTHSHHTVAAQTGTTVINQHTLGSLVIDFGSLSRALGFGNGSIVSLGSTGSG
ncbi:hypothetical protein ACQGAO_16245 [Rhodococcus sp. 1.20]